MHSALASVSLAYSAATSSYTLAPSRTLAFRQNLAACRIQSPRFAAPLFSYLLAPICEGCESLFAPARLHPSGFSCTYKSLGGQPLWIHIHTNPPGVWGRSRSSEFTNTPSRVASHVLSIACRLFCAPKKVNSFAIKQIQTLFRKHPGWGYVNIQAPCRATWTRRTHPIINAARLRCQVYG
jgi:hypothetical protein